MAKKKILKSSAAAPEFPELPEGGTPLVPEEKRKKVFYRCSTCAVTLLDIEDKGIENEDCPFCRKGNFHIIDESKVNRPARLLHGVISKFNREKR